MGSPPFHAVLMARSLPPHLFTQVRGAPGEARGDIDIVDALQRDTCQQDMHGDAFVHLHAAPQDREQWSSVLRTLGPCTGVFEFTDVFFDTEDGKLRRNNLWYFDRAGEKVLKFNASRNQFDCLLFNATRDAAAIKHELGRVLGDDHMDELQSIATIKMRRLMFGANTVIDVATLASNAKHIVLRTTFRLDREREGGGEGDSHLCVDEGSGPRLPPMRYVNSPVVEWMLDAGAIEPSPSMAPQSEHYARMPHEIKQVWREQLRRMAKVPTQSLKPVPPMPEWRHAREWYATTIKPRLADLRAEHGDVWAVFFPDNVVPTCFNTEQEAGKYARQCEAGGVPVVTYLGDESVDDTLLLNEVLYLAESDTN